jgi:hypothetical protein
VVTVLMPPTAARPHPVDLLLCAHHYRVSRAALAAVGAVVIDETGAVVQIPASGHGTALTAPAPAGQRR